MKVGDEDKSWAPHTVCYVCAEDLRKWSKVKKKAFRFVCPSDMEGAKNPGDDCYFCCCNVKGYCCHPFISN
jgi:hypothetical protein